MSRSSQKISQTLQNKTEGLEILDNAVVQSIEREVDEIFRNYSKFLQLKSVSPTETSEFKNSLEERLSQLEVYVRKQVQRRTNWNNSKEYNKEGIKTIANTIIQKIREPYKDFLIDHNLKCTSGFYNHAPSTHFAGLILPLKHLKRTMDLDQPSTLLLYGDAKVGKTEMLGWFANEYANTTVEYVVKDDKDDKQRNPMKILLTDEKQIEKNQIMSKNKSQRFYRFFSTQTLAKNLDSQTWYSAIKKCVVSTASGDQVNVLIADRLRDMPKAKEFWQAISQLKQHVSGQNFCLICVVQNPLELSQQVRDLFDAKMFMDHMNEDARYNLILGTIPHQWNFSRYLRDVTLNKQTDYVPTELTKDEFDFKAESLRAKPVQLENKKEELKWEQLQKTNFLKVLEDALKYLAKMSGAQTDVLYCHMRKYGFPVERIRTSHTSLSHKEESHTRMAGMGIDELKNMVLDFFLQLTKYFEEAGAKWSNKVQFKPDWIYMSAFGPNHMQNVRFGEEDYFKFLEEQTRFLNGIISTFVSSTSSAKSIKQSNKDFEDFVSGLIEDLRKKYQNTWKPSSYEGYMRILSYYLTNKDVDPRHVPIDENELLNQKYVVELNSKSCIFQTNIILYTEENLT
jgi:hypothetical protein